MSSTSLLVRSLGEIFGDSNISVNRVGEVTLEIERELVKDACRTLKQDPNLAFEICVDVAGVDYASYGEENPDNTNARPGERFAVVYHLLSVSKNHRVRVRTILDDEFPLVDSVTEIWSGTNWYEREAFDMYGIIFEGHPDLRRLLTDYGFIGHPFRKDFPLSGHVEMRYDADKGRVVYQPVTIEPRTLVPRIIREDGFGDRDT